MDSSSWLQTIQEKGNHCNPKECVIEEWVYDASFWIFIKKPGVPRHIRFV